MLKFMKSLSLDNRGVSALEYAILAAVLLAAVVAGVEILGPGIKGAFQGAADALVPSTTS